MESLIQRLPAATATHRKIDYIPESSFRLRAQKNLKASNQRNSKGGNRGHFAKNTIAASHSLEASYTPQKTPYAEMSNHVITGIESNRRNTTSLNETIKKCSEECHPSHGWRWMPHHLTQQELWLRIRDEAREDAEAEPALASVLHSTVLVHNTFPRTMAFILANKLASSTLLGTHLLRLIRDAYEEDPFIIDACSADLQSVFDRDPACDRYTQCMLYFKGFMAIQSHRIAHWLWSKGRKALALAIQSRVSEVFHVDIHPAAQLGRGIMIDHATGVVIGETAVVGDNVSFLHHTTLGGSGIGKGIRHPSIGHGVLVGAGATIIGPIHVGCGTKIGAGTVVTQNLPSYCVAVGVPARVVKWDCACEPCYSMDQCHDFIPDFQI